MMKTKLPKWPKTKFEKDLEKFGKRITKDCKAFGKWLFFYQYKDSMDAIFHIFDVIALIFIAWRLLIR